MRRRYTLLLTVLIVPLALVALVLGAAAAPRTAAPAFPDPSAYYGYLPLHSLMLSPGSSALSYLLRSPDGQRLYMIADGGVALVNGASGDVIAQAGSPDWTAQRLALDPDGVRLLVLPEDERTMPVVVLDAATLQPLQQYSIPVVWGQDMVIGKQHFYVTPYLQYTGHIPPYTAVYVYDIGSGTVITTIESQDWADRYHLALHDELLYVGMGSWHAPNHVQQYSLSSGAPVLSATAPSGFVKGMALSPDGSRLVVLSDRLQLFSTHPLMEIDSRPYHIDDFSSSPLPYTWVSFSPDGAYLYTTYEPWGNKPYHPVEVLDVATLEPVLTFNVRAHFNAPPISVLANSDLAVAARIDLNAYLDIYTPATAQTMLPMVGHDYCGSPLHDSFDFDNGRWPVADYGSVAYYYDDGEYVIEHHGAQWAAVSAGDVWHDGKELSVTARAVSGNPIYGLVYGLNADWSDFYSFEVAPRQQTWFLMRYTASGGWHRIAYGQNAAINPNGPNRLRLSANSGDWGLIYVNDVSVYQVNVLVPDGRVGLSAASLTNSGAAMRFDDYLFVGVHCPAPGARAAHDAAFTIQQGGRGDMWQALPERPALIEP